MTKFDAVGEVFIPGVTPGFQARDLLRFFLVDIIILLVLRLLYYYSLLPNLDLYVLLHLAGKVCLGIYLVWLVSSRPDGWRSAGTDRAGRWWGWLLAFAVLAAVLPVVIGLADLNLDLVERFHRAFGFQYHPAPQEVSIILFNDLASPWVRGILLLFVVVLGPAMEELAFRGVGMDGYGKTGGAFRAVFWPAVLFGLYHFDVARILPLAAIGAAFGVGRLLSRSLWCSIGLHVAYNAFVLAWTLTDGALFR